MTTSETYATRNDPVQIRTPDGCRLAVRRFGPEEAPPLLLIAGGEGGMQRWRCLLPELCVDDLDRAALAAAGCTRSLAERLRVVAYDARGVAWSSRSHGVARTVKEAAADAIGVAAALFEGPFHLAGHSLGAAAALEVALAAGALVKSLTLVSATVPAEGHAIPDPAFLAERKGLGDLSKESEPARRDALLRRLVAQLFTPAFAEAEPRLIDVLTDEARTELAWRARLASHGQDVTGEDEALAERLASPDFGERLDLLTVPTLLVHGRHDRPVPLANAEELAGRIPGARLEILDGGHELPVERSSEIIDLVERHVAASILG